MSRRRVPLALSVLLSLVFTAGVGIILVFGAGTTNVSQLFSFQPGKFYWLSHPVCSTLPTATAGTPGTADDLRASMGLSLGDVEVAVLTQTTGNPPAWDCYPATATIVNDFCLATTGGPCTLPHESCITRSNVLPIPNRKGVMVRVAPGGSFTWTGLETATASYTLQAGAYYLVSLQYDEFPFDAEEALTAFTPTCGGTVTRLEPGSLAGPPPTFEFWTGTAGNATPPNFAITNGEGLMVRPNCNELVTGPGGIGDGEISGKVFTNLDFNGTYNTGEELVGRRVFLRQGATTVGFVDTDSNGDYLFDDVEGPATYDVDVDQQSCATWNPAGPAVANQAANNTITTGVDFLLESPITDLELTFFHQFTSPIQLTACSTALPPQDRVTYCATYENTGTTTENNARVVVAAPPNTEVTIVGGSETSSCTQGVTPGFSSNTTTNEVIWNVGTPFMPGDTCTACFDVQVLGGTGTLGNILSASASAQLNSGGTQDLCTDTTNSATLNVNNSCAYDPNDKTVTPVGCGTRGYTPMGASPFRYRVRFQNEGTAAANLVEITDALDPSLDHTTVKVLSTSHTLTGLTLGSGGQLVFTFDGINLPPKSVDEPGSQGFVNFEVLPKAGLPAGTEILNTAGIVFDFNPPIITNTVRNTLTTNNLPFLNFTGPETCNNIDDDCDGTADDYATVCGRGECASTGSCTSGVDSCSPGAPTAEVCDGLDNDCNGVADNSDLSVSETGDLSWTGLPGETGYDVLVGNLSTLHSTGGDFSTTTDSCLVDDHPALLYTVPAPEWMPDNRWFLIRGANCSYGTAGRDSGIGASAAACP